MSDGAVAPMPKAFSFYDWQFGPDESSRRANILHNTKMVKLEAGTTYPMPGASMTYLDAEFPEYKSVDKLMAKKTHKIHIAASEGNLGRVKWHIFRNVSPNICDGIGETPLQKSSRNGHLEVVDFLLQFSYDSLAINDALHLAIAFGHIEITKLLIAKGARIGPDHQPIFFATQHAIRTGNPEILDLLLENGARIDQADRFGKSALSYFIDLDNDDVKQASEILCRKGADMSFALRTLRK
ncbi:MAG: ankyrin repeat domain-containing protein [Candidatus Berkelbacteria bacterium]|nr:ankyrin repeat domain-containing protein [Candidatus Berkelbacteria bacterium]